MSRSRRYDYAAIRALLDVEIDHRVIAQEIGCSMGLVGLIASGRIGRDPATETCPQPGTQEERTDQETIWRKQASTTPKFIRQRRWRARKQAPEELG